MREPSRPDAFDAIAGRAASATNGPWRLGRFETWTGDGHPVRYVYGGTPGADALVIAECQTEECDANAAFIAAAREDVPRLLAVARTADRLIRLLYGDRAPNDPANRRHMRPDVNAALDAYIEAVAAIAAGEDPADARD